jgi:hypothetical protein
MKVCCHIEGKQKRSLYLIIAEAFGIHEVALIDLTTMYLEKKWEYPDIEVKTYPDIHGFLLGHKGEDIVLLDVNSETPLIDFALFPKDAWLCIGPNGGWWGGVPNGIYAARLPISRDIFADQALVCACAYLRGVEHCT